MIFLKQRKLRKNWSTEPKLSYTYFLLYNRMSKRSSDDENEAKKSRVKEIEEVSFPDKIKEQIGYIEDKSLLFKYWPDDLRWLLKELIINQPVKTYVYKHAEYTNDRRVCISSNKKMYTNCGDEKSIELSYYDINYQDMVFTYDFPDNITISPDHLLIENNLIFCFTYQDTDDVSNKMLFYSLKIKEDYSIEYVSSLSCLNFLTDWYNKNYNDDIEPRELFVDNYAIESIYETTRKGYIAVDFGEAFMYIHYDSDGKILEFTNVLEDGIETDMPYKYKATKVNEEKKQEYLSNGGKYQDISTGVPKANFIISRKKATISECIFLLTMNGDQYQNKESHVIDELSNGKLIFDFAKGGIIIILSPEYNSYRASIVNVNECSYASNYYIRGDRHLVIFCNDYYDYIDDETGDEYTQLRYICEPVYD